MPEGAPGHSHDELWRDMLTGRIDGAGRAHARPGVLAPDGFYGTAAKVIDAREGIVDKFVGDEVVALFIPGFAGSDHAADPIAAARELLRETGNDASDPWIPVGASVHTGLAYVGVVGEGDAHDFTALGDSAIRRTQQLGSRPRPGPARSSSARQRR